MSLSRLERWPAERLMTLITFGVGFWVVIGLLGIVVLGGDALEARRAVRRERSALAADRAAADDLLRIRRQFDAVTGDLAAIEPTGHPRLFVPTLVQQLQALAGQSGLTLASVDPDLGVGADRVPTAEAALRRDGRLPVTVELTGRYPAVLSFVEALQTAPKALELNAVSLATEPGGEDGLLRATLSLTAWYVPGVPEDRPTEPPPYLVGLITLDGTPPPMMAEAPGALPPVPGPDGAAPGWPPGQAPPGGIPGGPPGSMPGSMPGGPPPGEAMPGAGPPPGMPGPPDGAGAPGDSGASPMPEGTSPPAGPVGPSGPPPGSAPPAGPPAGPGPGAAPPGRPGGAPSGPPGGPPAAQPGGQPGGQPGQANERRRRAQGGPGGQGRPGDQGNRAGRPGGAPGGPGGGPGGGPPRMTREDLQRIVQNLPPEAQQKLAAMSPAERKQLEDDFLSLPDLPDEQRPAMMRSIQQRLGLSDGAPPGGARRFRTPGGGGGGGS